MQWAKDKWITNPKVIVFIIIIIYIKIFLYFNILITLSYVFVAKRLITNL